MLSVPSIGLALPVLSRLDWGDRPDTLRYAHKLLQGAPLCAKHATGVMAYGHTRLLAAQALHLSVGVAGKVSIRSSDDCLVAGCTKVWTHQIAEVVYGTEASSDRYADCQQLKMHHTCSTRSNKGVQITYWLTALIRSIQRALKCMKRAYSSVSVHKALTHQASFY
eukprot:7069941-Pyramimonas_sp.AAC.2